MLIWPGVGLAKSNTRSDLAMWLRAGFYQGRSWFGPKNPAVVRPSRGAKPAPASGASLGGRIAVEARSAQPCDSNDPRPA